MTEEEFVKALSDIGITITEKQRELFKVYVKELLEYNQKVNLTAVKDENGVYLKHFYDSLLLLKYIDITDKTVLDIGSGAGFPGIPLKIMNPSLELTLLEANGKRFKFLSYICEKLELDVEVINARAEEYAKTKRESFDLVTSRAVTNMPVLVELSLPYVKVNGKFIAYKGAIEEDAENGLFAIETLGGKLEKIIYDKLPIEEAVRSFVIVRKKCKTDERYPRLFDKINKKPLQNNR